jgi:glycosyltransferase involved in cell wall biosynthesis
MRLGDRIVAVSAAERDALVARGFPRNKVETVLNGTQGSLRERALALDEPIELQRPCVLTAAGLHGRKGVDVLVKAFSVAAASTPEWHLYISGDGTERPALEQLAEAGGIGDRIHFVGFRNQPQALLEQADVFSLASYADPCSLVLCEARNAGCAIVATAVGGSPEVLNFGRAGRLVPPGDVSALADALAELMNDPTALRQARVDSKRKSEFFSVDRMATDYDQVYVRAMQGKLFEAPLARAGG